MGSSYGSRGDSWQIAGGSGDNGIMGFSAFVRVVLVWCGIAVAGGCFRSGERRDLASDDPSLKIPAIVHAVESEDDSSIRRLIDDLNSDDPAVRLYAIQGLERLTGESFGYRYYDDEPARRMAARRWREWLGARNGSGG